jgi:hypothetical protein
MAAGAGPSGPRFCESQQSCLHGRDREGVAVRLSRLGKAFPGGAGLGNEGGYEMTKINRWVVLVAGIGALSFAILVGDTPTVRAAPPGPASPLPVSVTNAPLPVSGSVNATVMQGGPLTVGITGTPTVLVAPTAPTTSTWRISLDDGFGEHDIWTNNSGKVVVIESLSCTSFDMEATPAFVISAGDLSYTFVGQAVTAGPSAMSAVTKMFVLPGEQVQIGSGDVVDCMLSGHLEAYSESYQ